jgi:AcrR family transcriptional regulator
MYSPYRLYAVYTSQVFRRSTAYSHPVPDSPSADPTTARGRYHHGSLREQLMSSAVALIEAEGVAAVSLRRLAREAGVSPRAPYHHFEDRSALLAALCVRAHDDLFDSLRRAREAAPDGVGALGAVLRTYVGFAAEHPGRLRLLLRPELSEPQRHPDVLHAGQRSVDLLTDVVRDCQREGTAPTGDPLPLVATIWALAVGVVTLWLDGPLEHNCADVGLTPQELTARISVLLESLLRRP